MIQELTTGIVAGCTAFGIITIGADTTIGIKEAIAVCVSTCGIVWYLGRKFRSIELSLRSHGRILRLLCLKQGIPVAESTGMSAADDEESTI